MFGAFRNPPPPPVPARELRETDHAVAEQLRAIDILLDRWVDRPKKWELVDQLLDQRLALRPPDVMASRPVPVVPGWSS